jgi:hypothetical protein
LAGTTLSGPFSFSDAIFFSIFLSISLKHEGHRQSFSSDARDLSSRHLMWKSLSQQSREIRASLFWLLLHIKHDELLVSFMLLEF